jgi:hypothetical protein
MKEHVKRNIPFLPLYDSMIVRKSDEAKTRAIFNHVIKRVKFERYIAVK